jgi:hypothetical protein
MGERQRRANPEALTGRSSFARADVFPFVIEKIWSRAHTLEVSHTVEVPM